MSYYPSAVLTTTNVPNVVNDITWLNQKRFNDWLLELRAITAELGTLPKGGYATVKARLDAMGATVITHCIEYTAMRISSVDGILGFSAWRDGTTTVFLAQPDLPRAISVFVVAGPLENPTGTITINGIDADGAVIQEVINVDTAGTVTYYTLRAFLKITSVVIDQTDGGTQSLFSVGWYKRFGLPNYPFNATSDVIGAYLSGVLQTTVTINATYGTVDPFAGGIGTENWRIIYRPNMA